MAGAVAPVLARHGGRAHVSERGLSHARRRCRMSESPLAVFTVCHVYGRRLARLCFGHGPGLYPTADALDHGRRVRLGEEGRVFAVLWWEQGPDFNEQWHTLAVLRVIPSGGRPVPDVSGAVEVLGAVGQAGPPGMDGAVDRLVNLIADMAAAGVDPSRLLADYWRAAVHDVQFGLRPAVPPAAGRRQPSRRPRASARPARAAA